MLSSAFIQVNNTRQLNHPQDTLESQASITTNSVTDDCDFRTIDISSSAQTSTVSPQKSSSHNMPRSQPNEEAEVNLNSFSFYSGPAANEKDHISRFRKSLVLSNSFNSISSLPTPDTSVSEVYKNIQPNEEPTKNLGMVISPSMRALSDILTSKVSLNKSATNLQQNIIREDDEEEDNFFYDYDYNGATDTETILPPVATTQQPVSLIDDVFIPKQSASSETLQINIPSDKSIQGDLIDLSSPPASQKQYNLASPEKFVDSLPSINQDRLNNASYNDIYESFLPPDHFDKETPYTEQKPLEQNINLASKRVSKRFSTISDVNFNEFQLQSPAILFNDPLESNHFVQPTLTKSLSKLTIHSETSSFDRKSFLNDENAEMNINEEDSEEFSFIPSETNTIINQRNIGEDQHERQTCNNDRIQAEYPTQKTPKQLVSSTFTQTTPKRFSIEFVSEKDDKSPFLNDYLKTINLSQTKSPQLNDTDTIIPTALGISTILTPKPDAPTIAEKNEVLSTPNKIPDLANEDLLVTNVLNSSPIRNTSPTFENYKNSPTASPKRNVIKLSNQFESKNLSLDQTSHATLKPAKPKSKLTFKSFFSKSTDNLTQPDKQKKKSPLLPSSEKFQRPKSFNLTSKEPTQTTNNATSKKEKTKSLGLLSGWKRKSLGFNKESTKEHTATVKSSKSSNNIFSKSHFKAQSTASLPVLSSPIAEFNGIESPKSPHRHSKSTTEVFSKKLPDLPPPRLDDTSLLERYGFVDGSESKSPIFSQSPEVKFERFDAHKDLTTVKETISKRSLESETPPMDLPQPQSATFAETTPTFEHNAFDPPTERVTVNTDNVNSSSVYDTTNEAENPANRYDDELSFFKPPQKLGTPKVDSYNAQPLDEELMMKTPTPLSPSLSVVESFVQSPNKYHIGDDMFPKSLGRNEIESIVSLERSRSFRSVKSHQHNNTGLNHKNSILRMVQNTSDQFNEIQLPDGMVLVKSPTIDQFSILSKPSRKSSILKNSVRSQISPHNSQRFSVDRKSSSIRNSVSYNSITSSALDDEFNDLIDLIHFGDDDSQFNTDFNIDTAVQVSISPLRSMPRDSSVPDFLGIDTDLSTDLENNISFKRDFRDDSTLNGQTDEKSKESENNLSSQVSQESDAPPTPPPHLDNQHSQSLLYNKTNGTADENQFIYDAEFYDNEFGNVFDSQNEPAASDYYTKTESNDNTSFNYNPLISPFQNRTGKDLPNESDNRKLNHFQPPVLEPETQSAIFGSLINQRPVDTIVQSDSDISISFTDFAQYNSSYLESPVNNPPANFGEILPSRFSVNNPFTDYTQSYDNEVVIKPSIGAFNSEKFEKRKSLDFSTPIQETKPTHASSSSLPTPQQNKPKTLKKKNRTSVSFGSMFESLITTKENAPRGVKFSSRILLYDTYGEDEYDRKPDSATCNSLTPQIAMEIKNELNALKSEMPVHEESRCYTHFF